MTDQPDQEFPTPFSDPDGWEETDFHRLVKNPNRSWYNRLWEPELVAQTMYVKYSVYGQMIGKWVGHGIDEDAQL